MSKYSCTYIHAFIRQVYNKTMMHIMPSIETDTNLYPVVIKWITHTTSHRLVSS